MDYCGFHSRVTNPLSYILPFSFWTRQKRDLFHRVSNEFSKQRQKEKPQPTRTMFRASWLARDTCVSVLKTTVYVMFIFGFAVAAGAAVAAGNAPNRTGVVPVSNGGFASNHDIPPVLPYSAAKQTDKLVADMNTHEESQSPWTKVGETLKARIEDLPKKQKEHFDARFKEQGIDAVYKTLVKLFQGFPKALPVIAHFVEKTGVEGIVAKENMYAMLCESIETKRIDWQRSDVQNVISHIRLHLSQDRVNSLIKRRFNPENKDDINLYLLFHHLYNNNVESAVAFVQHIKNQSSYPDRKKILEQALEVALLRHGKMDLKSDQESGYVLSKTINNQKVIDEIRKK